MFNSWKDMWSLFSKTFCKLKQNKKKKWIKWKERRTQDRWNTIENNINTTTKGIKMLRKELRRKIKKVVNNIRKTSL